MWTRVYDPPSWISVLYPVVLGGFCACFLIALAPSAKICRRIVQSGPRAFPPAGGWRQSPRPRSRRPGAGYFCRAMMNKPIAPTASVPRPKMFPYSRTNDKARSLENIVSASPKSIPAIKPTSIRHRFCRAVIISSNTSVTVSRVCSCWLLIWVSSASWPR